MGILDSMKKDIANSGGSKGKIFLVGTDKKRRVRFLVDFENGIELIFHDSFGLGVNALCAKEINEKCKHCNNEDLRHRKLYGWPVYDYDSNEVKIFLYAVNNCTPIPGLISMYENYGTILDRDFVIERKGKQQNTSYTIVPLDKAKFKTQVKIPTGEAMIKVIAKAFPPNAVGKPREENDDSDGDEKEQAKDYTQYSAKELYQMLKDRDQDVQAKKSKEYYIDLLEELDDSEIGDDWDDETEEAADSDEW